MKTVLTDQHEHTIAASGGLCVSAADAEAVTGWILKPEGMCRDSLCVPLGADARRDGNVDLAAFWRTLGHPVVSDRTGDVWVLGTAADSRGTGAISTRRLRDRPGSSALDATGWAGPKAAAKTEPAGRPSSISTRITVSERCADSSQLSANCRLP